MVQVPGWDAGLRLDGERAAVGGLLDQVGETAADGCDDGRTNDSPTLRQQQTQWPRDGHMGTWDEDARRETISSKVRNQLMEQNFEPGIPKPLSVRHVCQWVAQSQDPGTWAVRAPLTLPPLQRNAVWRPRQVLDLWKSMLDGLPIGLFYLEKIDSGQSVVDPARRTDLTPLDRDGWSLFDGQQRIRAIALGAGDPFGEGRCLWVKFSGGNYELLLSSRTQPAGYNADGAKHAVGTRREWSKKNPSAGVWHVGASWWKNAGYPVGCSAVDTVKLADLLGILHDPVCAAVELAQTCAAWKARLANIDEPGAVFMRMPAIVENNPSVKLELFRRVGAGGTPLSQPEQLYAAYKTYKPGLRDVVERIQSKVSAILTAGQIVQAAIRMAHTQAFPQAGWAPGFDLAVKVLSGNADGEERKWLDFLNTLLTPIGGQAPLEQAFAAVLDLLSKSGDEDTFYLPGIALAQLPAELWQVFAFWWVQNRPAGTNSRKEMVRFALFWRLAVTNPERAVQVCFRAIAADKMEHFDARLLYRVMVAEKHAYALASPPSIDKFFRGSEKSGQHGFLKLEQRFPAGTAYREIADSWWFGAKMLPWLQRRYMDSLFANQSPLSDHEDDLPYDVDHLCAKGHWQADGRSFKLKERGFCSKAEWEAAMGQPWVVGEALGNKRLVRFEQNRSDGDKPLGDKLPFLREGPYEVEKFGMSADFRLDGCSALKWLELDSLMKDNQPHYWTNDRLQAFQTVVECRTSELYREFYDGLGYAEWLENQTDGTS